MITFNQNELAIADSFFDPSNKILNSNVKAGPSESGKVVARLAEVSDADDQVNVTRPHHQRGPGVTLKKSNQLIFNFSERFFF